MSRIITPILLFLTIVFPLWSYAASGADQLREVAKEVAALKLGFGDYILGGTLTDEQKKIAGQNNISKTLAGTYKFVDGDIYVVAKSDDDTVIGIYKDYPAASRDDIRSMVGDLMMRYEEPTTMAHDQVIYWAFDRNGKISGDMYDFSKKTGETEMIATVKLQSSVPILPDFKKTVGPGPDQPGNEKDEVSHEESDLYVIISSTPMSKLFLALDKY